MILDSFKLRRLYFQLRYPEAYAIWDRAGEIAARMSNVWPGLKVEEGKPQQQTLRTRGVEVQTGITVSTIILSNEITFDQAKANIQEAFNIWRDALGLNTATRVSSRIVYHKNFDGIGPANRYLLEMGLTRWPSDKVFDQPLASENNSIDLCFRFEDKTSFSLLRLNTETINYSIDFDPELTTQRDINDNTYRVAIDFDRGLLGEIKLAHFRVDDWLKGFHHILRRDLLKVIGDVK